MSGVINVAIVPARLGSKSILNKNLQKIGAKSLVLRTITSAINSGIFKKIILTTDIPVLIEEYQNSQHITVRMRPPNLCK